MNRILHYIFKWSEWLIATLLFAVILFSFIEMIMVLGDNVQQHSLINNYKMILSEVLLLAVGLELILLIIRKDVYLVIDILILAISRKLIFYEESVDMLISVFAILLLLLFKYLIQRGNKQKRSDA
ncbi:phosphate-starvation-inducible PsiE family protein [Rubeoparvulum massiliense]|uniref:phosphate-starvation-inducible PsiE family protein n=1 Tax=Rubeoparvulum massiliense TaxID=1631346 RepID=UPI00065DE32D|nr:phosphate-starvation-inducible PsiE family protein [Rubeoparvulum massiliense]